MLFKVFDPDNTGTIEQDQIRAQFEESIKENGFTVEESQFNQLVEYLMKEFDPFETGEIRRDQMKGK